MVRKTEPPARRASRTRGVFEPHLHLGWCEGGLFVEDRSEVESGATNPLLRPIRRSEEAVLHPGFRVVHTTG